MEFLNNEAEVVREIEKSYAKHKKATIIESDDDDNNEDQPTQSDNDFLNDNPKLDNPNSSSALEEMGKKLEEKKVGKKRGRPPSKKNEVKKVKRIIFPIFL